MDIVGQNGNDGEHYDSTPVAGRSPTMPELYPQYYKDVRHLDFIDVYRVHTLFHVDDPSGCLQHADKKILLSGARTGGKPVIQDIREARDTLTRWLEMMEEDKKWKP
jgi:hypothetical protein